MVEIWDIKHAYKIHAIINDVFGDIDVAEAQDDLVLTNLNDVVIQTSMQCLSLNVETKSTPNVVATLIQG